MIVHFLDATGRVSTSHSLTNNIQGFTPDPYLSAKLSYLTVLGIQSAGVITSLKHYILYEQEPICTGELDDDGGRTNCTQVSANIGDKVLHELYLPSFVEGVRAGAGSVMWWVPRRTLSIFISG